ISIYEAKPGALGVNNGLIISDTNYATSIRMSSNTEGVCTRLFVTGKGEADITKYNPTGQRYIDDFTFFLPHMSEGLRKAVHDMNKLIENKRDEFVRLVDRRDAGNNSVVPRITAIGEELAYKNNFTPAQLVELAFFVRETSVSVNEISDEKQLYEYG